MRRWLLLAVLLFARPAMAAPDDVWAIDPRASTLAFTASQVGAFVNSRFPAWTGEIILDPADPGRNHQQPRHRLPSEGGEFPGRPEIPRSPLHRELGGPRGRRSL